MSSSTRNDLQSEEKNSYHTPASVVIIEPPPESRSIVENTALLVSKSGLWFESRFMADDANNTIFSFLRNSDPYHAFYQHKLTEYRNAQNQDIQPVAPAITCPEGITLKELGIIKLTAQFVVRYGMQFWLDLMTRVINDPQFAFTDSRFSFFSRLIDAYARVLRPYKKLLKNPGAVLEGFFNLLEGEKEKQEEGVEMHAFVGGLDYFAHKQDKELSPRGHFSTMMNPPTQMQSFMHDAPATDPFRDPLPEPPTFPLTYPEGITPKELGIIKLTAQFVVRFGEYFCDDLIEIDDPQFEFMKRRTDRYYFFYLLVGAYSRVIMPCQKLGKPCACLETVLEGFINLIRGDKQQEEGVEMAMIGLHDFVGGNHYVVNREDEELSSPGHNVSTQMQSVVPDAPATADAKRYFQTQPLNLDGITFTLKELDIMKLTAQFVGVYGVSFERDLMERVTMNPQFESQFQFMKSTDSRHDFFVLLALAYSRSEKLRKNGASSATVVEDFINRLGQVPEKERLEMCFEYFAYDWQFPPGNLPMVMNPPPRMQSSLGSQFSPGPGMSPPPPLPLPEEPEPKRQKFGESALVSEDQFHAQARGSSTIRVSVPSVDDGRVIENPVRSLSENVASLKEKISGEIQIPANKQKLSGKAGFLKDSMSHYNVGGAGETLTLSL